MHRWVRRRPAKGAVLVEFALSALLLIVVLLGTVEFGLEIYARSTTDRVANRMAEAYASTRDPVAATAVVGNQADALLQRCLRPPRFVVFDDVAALDPLRDPGRLAATDAPEEAAVAFRVEVECRWPRLTPVLGGLLGSVDGYTSQVFAKFRTEGTP